VHLVLLGWLRVGARADFDAGRAGAGGEHGGKALAASVFVPVAVGGLIQGQGEVKESTGIDLAIPDLRHRFGKEAAHRCGAAVKVNIGVAKFLTGEFNAGCDADITGGSVGEFLDLRYPFLAAFGGDAGCAEFAGEFLPGLVAAHRHDALRPELLGSQYGREADPAATDDDGLARSSFCGHGAKPSGAADVGGREQAMDETLFRGCYLRP